MAVTIREALQNAKSDGTAASVTTGAGTLSTDLLMAVGYSSFYDLATGFGPPSGGGWTQVPDGTADLGLNNTKIRSWTRTADGGAQQIDLAPIVDEDVALVVLVLAGADTTTPVDDAGNATSPGTGSPSPHVAPSITPTTADAFLVCAAASSVFNGGAAYTPPASMTERADFPVPSNAISCTAATEQLAASGATGTRTFEYGGNNDPGLAISVAIRTASTGVTGTLAVTEAPDTLTASGTATPPAITGSLAETEADDTLAASGTFTPEAITGTVSVTELADTLASAGSHTPPPVTGTLAAAEQPDTLAASGSFTPEGITGSLAQTEADDALAASGTTVPPNFTGSLTVTEQSDTLSASGTVVIEGIAGHVAATETSDTLTAAGTFLLATRPGASGLAPPATPSTVTVAESIPAVIAAKPAVATAIAAEPAVATSGGVA